MNAKARACDTNRQNAYRDRYHDKCVGLSSKPVNVDRKKNTRKKKKEYNAI